MSTLDALKKEREEAVWIIGRLKEVRAAYLKNLP